LSHTEPRILILDDEVEMQTLLQRYLGNQGFVVELAPDAQQLDALLASKRHAVLILDLMMPGENGLSICRRLRAGGETIPILMLTAKGDSIDRIIGLEMGADDYLPKPFEPRELSARLHALIRRQNIYAAKTPPVAAEVLVFGNFKLDLRSRVLLRDDISLSLTSGEFSLLRALASNPGRALTREQLLELISGSQNGRTDIVTERSIDVQILRLRRLIENDTTAPRYIQTVWGVGYLFSTQGTKARA
jgi:two-component system phosphate regulon response regulator OmpR